MKERIPRITGSFVDFSQKTHEDWRLLEWDFKDWLKELSDMKEAGINTVILHRTMRYGSVYYYSNFYETHLEKDWLRPFIDAAEDIGMAVYISGLVSDHFFCCDDHNFRRLMKRDINIYLTIIKELLEIYKGYDCISGIYISHEADSDNLKTADRLEAANKFFADLYSKIKDYTNLPILSSPFYTKKLNPEELSAFWHQFLDKQMFDILAIQDGIGCDRNIQPDDISNYFKPLSNIFKKKNIKFWHNAESFSFHPGFKRSEYNRDQIWLHPAPLQRLAIQVKKGMPYTEKTITWEFGHFLSRMQVGEDWYQLFKVWNLGGEL